MLKTYYHESFTSDFLLARLKLKGVLEYLKKELVDITEDDLFDLRLVYNELIVNGIIHGNKKDLSKQVSLIIEMDDNLITSIVKDEGNGFDYSSLFKSKKPYEAAELLEHGRGLPLVISLVDFLEWNISGNEVKFYKRYRKVAMPKYSQEIKTDGIELLSM